MTNAKVENAIVACTQFFYKALCRRDLFYQYIVTIKEVIIG